MGSEGGKASERGMWNAEGFRCAKTDHGLVITWFYYQTVST